jgi:hypothetical protein
MFISGTGTVLNIWNSRQTGVVLHLIVQHGEVRRMNLADNLC